MNRGKSYRFLVVMLFFAFISLISRSIIYLVISLTVATIIIMLLSKDVKDRKTKEQNRVNANESNPKKQLQFTLPILFCLFGVIMVSYGLTGIFEMETMFTQLNIMVEEPFVLFFSVAIGILLSVYGLTITIKKLLQ